MKTSTIPVICSVALTAIIATGFSHWWSVRQFVIAFHDGIPASTMPHSSPSDPVEQTQAIAQSSSSPDLKPTTSAPDPDPTEDLKKQGFYEALIAKMKSVENQNRDLLDQVAETNRDIMKLQFRVDTHSESFRPLPVGEEQPFTSLDGGIGVLPPRAEPVALPTFE